MAVGRPGSRRGGQATRSAPIFATTSKSEKTRNGNPDSKKGKRRTYDSIELVQGHAPEIDQDDVDAFDEYKHFHGFLSELEPSVLAKRVKRQQPRNPAVSDYPSGTSMAPFPPFSAKNLAEERGYMEGDLLIEHRESSTVETGKLDSARHEADPPNAQLIETEPADYEATSRAFRNEPSASNRLPIKSRDGRVHLLSAEPVPSVSLPAEISIGQLPILHEATSESGHSSNSETETSPAERLLLTKEKLARVASAVIEDPEENIATLLKLREVMLKGSLKEQQLALLTMAAVYKDIIPGYRIRPLTDVENAEKATKEVKRTRAFEQDLVKGYQQFVNSLVAFCKISRRHASTGSVHPLKRVAVIAACSLLSSAPHFNFRTELFTILVGQICRKTVDESFSRSLATLTTIFANDEDGDASFEAIRLLVKKMKEREYQVDASVVSSFLELRLLNELEARASASAVDRKAKPKRVFINKKNKKLLKAQKEVEFELREAEATVDTESRERLQSETLKLVFAAYFRILQSGNRSVLGAALEGLARFAHLINVDFFGDLLEVLRQLLKEMYELDDTEFSSRASLLCIVTAFAIQTGQDGTKETIALDLSQFIQALYSIMVAMSFNKDIEIPVYASQNLNSNQRSTINVATEAEMLMRALDAVFFKQRSQATQGRLTAFAKRLAVSAANFPEKSAVASLELTKRLASRYAKIVTLYNTDDTAADGKYDGCTNSLEMTNTATTSAFELALFQAHYSPRVRQAAASLLETLRDSASNVRQ